MRRFVHPLFTLTFTLILAGSIASTSAHADDILLFDDSAPNGLINVTFNGIPVVLGGPIISTPSQSTAQILTSSPENVGVQLFVFGNPNLPSVTNYFNIYEPDGTLGDVITMTMSGDPVIDITFQSALNGVPLAPGITDPAAGSTATNLFETGQVQTATILATSFPGTAPVDINFISDPPAVAAPEPSTVLLLAIGLIGALSLGALRRKCFI